MKPAGSIAAAIWTAIVPMLAAAGGLAVLSACASCESTVRETSIPALATGAYYGAAIDQGAHRVYLADATDNAIDVVDVSSTPRFLQSIYVVGNPNGLAVAPDIHRLYAGLSGGGVAVIDTQEGSPTFLQMIQRVSVDATNADLLDYSVEKHRLFVSTGYGGQVAAVDTADYGITARYTVSARVAQPRYNPGDGMLYVSSPTTSSIVQINPADGQITRTYLIQGCKPSGLAINPAQEIALATCSGSVAIVNLLTGAHEVTQTVPGGDLVTYDSTLDQFAVASPHTDKDSSVGVFDGSGRFIGSVAASPKARAAVFDDAHGMVYAAAAAGMISFAPSACAPPPAWLNFTAGLAVFALPLFGLGLFLFLYARRRPRERPEPSYHDLQNEDLAFERERMRAFEDAVLGPINQGMRPEP